MNQRTPTGISFLDAAKGGIEYFMMKRATDPSYRTDRFFLVTFEDGLGAIKAGWNDTTAVFMHEIKSLKAFDLSDAGAALKRSFDLLNSNRLKSNVDTFGMGRQICSLESSVIVLITEAGVVMDKSGVLREFILPAGSSYTGSELYREPFRWDQRLYGILMRFPGTNSDPGGANQAQSMIAPMCEATGGKCLQASTMKQMFGCFDQILNKHSSNAPLSVAFNFEPLIAPGTHAISNPPSIAHQLAFVKAIHQPNQASSSNTFSNASFAPNPGVWPLPDDYTLIPNMGALPPRSAHPNIRYRPYAIAQPVHPLDFPFDAYPLEKSSFTEWMLANCKKGCVMECLIQPINDPLTTTGIPPFGYLKPHHEQNAVYLYVLPYHYHQLFLLLNNFQANTPKWKADFDRYASNVPSYYIGHLKNALKRWNPPNQGILLGPLAQPGNLISDTVAASCKDPPYSVVQWLKTLKERAETERNSMDTELSNLRRISAMALQMGSSHPRSALDASQHSLTDFGSNHFSFADLKNVKRADLFSRLQMVKDRIFSSGSKQNKFKPDTESNHHVPISEMGDYQAYLAKKPPSLRTIEDVLPDKPYFGNPFVKRGSQSNNTGFVDEADMPMGEAAAMQGNRKRKRNFGMNRPDRAKQFKISSAPASNSTAAPSNTASTSSQDKMDVDTSPAPAPVSPTPSFIQATSPTKSSLPQSNERTRQEQAQKLQMLASKFEDVVLALPTELHPVVTETIKQAEEEITPAKMLKNRQSNNSLKLMVLKAIRRPVRPDSVVLKQCFDDIRGNQLTKAEVIQEWIQLGLAHNRDLKPLFDELNS